MELSSSVWRNSLLIQTQLNPNRLLLTIASKHTNPSFVSFFLWENNNYIVFQGNLLYHSRELSAVSKSRKLLRLCLEFLKEWCNSLNQTFCFSLSQKFVEGEIKWSQHTKYSVSTTKKSNKTGIQEIAWNILVFIKEMAVFISIQNVSKRCFSDMYRTPDIGL